MPLHRLFKRGVQESRGGVGCHLNALPIPCTRPDCCERHHIRYVNGFSPVVNAAAAGGAGRGNTGEGEEAELTPTQIDAEQHRAALIHSGVMGSIGLASGIVALVLNLASFLAQTWLNTLWKTGSNDRLYASKLYAGLLIFAVNIILFGGNIALTRGFAIASLNVKRRTVGTDAATSAYLRAAAAMSGLLAFFALATAVADYLSLRSAEKELDARIDPVQKRSLNVETDLSQPEAD